MLERDEWNTFVKKYPNAKARRQADSAVDEAKMKDEHLTLAKACAIWNDCYAEVSGAKFCV